jgi:hypothetical protein
MTNCPGVFADAQIIEPFPEVRTIFVMLESVTETSTADVHSTTAASLSVSDSHVQLVSEKVPPDTANRDAVKMRPVDGALRAQSVSDSSPLPFR